MVNWQQKSTFCIDISVSTLWTWKPVVWNIENVCKFLLWVSISDPMVHNFKLLYFYMLQSSAEIVPRHCILQKSTVQYVHYPERKSKTVAVASELYIKEMVISFLVKPFGCQPCHDWGLKNGKTCTHWNSLLWCIYFQRSEQTRFGGILHQRLEKSHLPIFIDEVTLQYCFFLCIIVI